ncbi:MAG: HlyD family type I secretion periplasmic adaptor subunit [Magnetococcales bacterium]|nr:HlyD family type I secretion periplasmic adaptor subunit [Magnetococcales bacterium]MBF0439315.1 HlyD family type I secretion periplasmic adaptor subunit [Magnetococcales bacterium]
MTSSELQQATGERPKGKPVVFMIGRPPKKETPPPPPLAPHPAPPTKPVEGVNVQTMTKSPAPTVTPPKSEEFLDVLKPEKQLVQVLKQGNKQRRYMAQSVVLEESGLASLIRLALVFMTLVMIILFIWASFSTMDEMAPTIGEIMPAGPVQHIQHLEGGIVKATLVKEGDLVKEGQVLFIMAPEAALAELNQMMARFAALESQAARNRAFLDNKDPDFGAVPSGFAHLMRDQRTLLDAQRAFRESRKEVLKSKLDQKKTRVASLLSQQESLNRQMRSIDEELVMRRAGLAKGVVSRLSVLGIERDYSRVEGDIRRTQGDLALANKEMEEARKQLASLDDELRQEALKELGAVSSELSQLKEGMLRQKNRVERLDVRTPVKGVVKNLQMETLRGVVPPGGLLTEIVPVDATRRVETRINPLDVGHVRAGQHVTVKVNTYDFARYGGINGVLESISASTFKEPNDPNPYYKGIIRLDASYVGVDPTQNEVLPGMGVQADIHTGSKTLMEYMLKPIYASVNKAFRER